MGSNEDTIPAPTVIKIDPDGRYVVIFEMHLTPLEKERINNILKQWWESGDKFLVLGSGYGITFERMESE